MFQIAKYSLNKAYSDDGKLVNLMVSGDNAEEEMMKANNEIKQKWTLTGNSNWKKKSFASLWVVHIKIQIDSCAISRCYSTGRSLL